MCRSVLEHRLGIRRSVRAFCSRAGLPKCRRSGGVLGGLRSRGSRSGHPWRNGERLRDTILEDCRNPVLGPLYLALRSLRSTARIGPVSDTTTGYPSSIVGSPRGGTAAVLETSTAMQGWPSRLPTPAPTTPGSPMSSLAWASSTSSIGRFRMPVSPGDVALCPVHRDAEGTEHVANRVGDGELATVVAGEEQAHRALAGVGHQQ
jgi:hypothetical protein